MEDTINDANFVSAEDLCNTDFPPVNVNAVNAFSETAENASKTENNTLEGYNPEIHETPPRKNKHGQWAKKRGNKKGFVFGKSANAQKIEIPPTQEEIDADFKAQSQAVQSLEVSTAQAAQIISTSFFFGLRVFADYEPNQTDAQAHYNATYEYLMTTGGVDMPPWATLAAVSVQQIMLASQKEKAKTRLQKIKEWFLLKIYVFKNRKNKGSSPLEEAETK